MFIFLKIYWDVIHIIDALVVQMAESLLACGDPASIPALGRSWEKWNTTFLNILPWESDTEESVATVAKGLTWLSDYTDHIL